MFRLVSEVLDKIRKGSFLFFKFSAKDKEIFEIIIINKSEISFLPSNL